MDILVVFFFLGIIVTIFILPFVALAKSRSAQRNVEEVSRRIRKLESELRQLRENPNLPPPLAADVELQDSTVKEAAGDQAEPETVSQNSPDPEPLSILATEMKRQRVAAKPPADLSPEVPTVATKGEPDAPQTASAQSTKEDTSKPPAPKSEGFLKKRLETINWEQFMGVRLFAWLGGLALFLAAAFFVKYSFEQDLISPEMRVAIGFLVGVGLLVGGVKMSAKPYKVTAHTLMGAGVVILYAVTFACRTVYHFEFFGPTPTALLMILITVTAFFVSVRLNALFVAVLGMLGGFLTPILISSGQDNPVGLFTYIALLDIGLLCVASTRRWDWLNLAAAVGTVLMQFGWLQTYFEAEKVFIAMTVFLGFDALYLGGFLWERKCGKLNRWITAAALLLPAVTFLFVFVLIGNSTTGLRPGVIFSFILGADLCLLGMTVLYDRLRNLHLFAGAIVFLQLAIWTATRVSDTLLYWALAGYFAFAVLHAAFPVWVNRRFPERPVSPVCHLFPLIGLVLTLIPMLKLDSVSLIVWPVILLMNVVAIGLAALTASIAGILYALLVTAAIAFVWLTRVSIEITGLSVILMVIGGFALVFTVAGVVVGRKILARQTIMKSSADATLLPNLWCSDNVRKQIPALSGILPFLLLVMVVDKVPMMNPSPIFGMALLFVALLLGLARIARMEWLPAVGLGCTFLTEFTWHFSNQESFGAGVALLWYLLFYAVFALYPFIFQKSDGDRLVSWISAAVSGPVQFFLIYNLTKRAWPNDIMGMIPALFALPAIAGLVFVLRQIPVDHPKRNTILAWFGGVALLFITLVFPIQFERQWLTISWALEGAALLWLFHRIPHHGLRYVAAGLLAAAFIRLALNPAVLQYHPRATTAIFNWYLYTYGIVIGCMFASARLVKPPDHMIFGKDTRPWLYALGTVLAFLLLNIEIADYFNEPGTMALTFSFGGSLALDLSYSISWGLFALALLIVGIMRRIKGARYAGIALLGVTLLKLFFHDLAALNQLYRVAALVGVATIAIVASFLYQKFLVNDPDGKGSNHKSESVEDS